MIFFRKMKYVPPCHRDVRIARVPTTILKRKREEEFLVWLEQYRLELETMYSLFNSCVTTNNPRFYDFAHLVFYASSSSLKPSQQHLKPSL